MASKFEWEVISDDKRRIWKDYTERAKVYGGWIVRNMIWDYQDVAISTSFIPDPDHKWSLEEEFDIDGFIKYRKNQEASE